MAEQTKEQEIEAMRRGLNVRRDRAEYLYSIEHEEHAGDVEELDSNAPEAE